MTDGLNGIIAQLEQQKAAIEHALAALHDVAGIPATASPASAPATRKGGMTPAGRRRLIAALKKRWAAKKAAESVPESLAKPTRRKVRLTPEGRKRLAESMKRRWAVKRSAAAVRNTARKARATKKAG